MIKTRGQVADAVALGQIIIRGVGGRSVRVADVARVEDGEKEKRSAALLNGHSAISLVVTKQSGANTVRVAALVREAVEALEGRLPDGASLTIPIDNSTFIVHAIEDVQFDLLLGGVLAILIIMVFLHDWRATFISALALPTSVVATFAFINVMGFTFNNMTMLALSLSIGILIDDAIVVIENIHRHLEMGKPPMKAASEASREIGLAVLATTACIVAVFLPVAIMKGIIGRFFFQFGLTVAFAVSVSFLVAFTLTPMLSARMLKTSRRNGSDRRPNVLTRAIEGVLQLVERTYRWLIGHALRHRFLTLVVAAASLFAAVYVNRYVPFEFMPPDDRGQFQVRLELPPGTSFDRTQRYLRRVSDALVAMPGVRTVFGSVGGGAQQEVNKGGLTVGLVPRRERAFSQLEAIEYARKLVSQFKGAKIFVEQTHVVGGGGGAFRSAKIQFNLRGNDYDELNAGAERIIAKMKEAGGYVDIDTTFRGGKPEVAVTIRRARAADLGVPVVGVAMALRTLYSGAKATEISIDGTRYDVRVKLDEAYRRDPASIGDLKVRSISGPLVPLSTVIARPEEDTGPASIERQSRQRQVTIFANLEGKALGAATKEIEGWARELPPEIDSDWAGMGKIMKESVAAMLETLVLAIILIYLILAAQFESFLHPFTIMLSLPLSLVGALGALVLAGMSMNIFSMIGIIMLMGLVTKNAILLVDYTNTLRDRGQERVSALTDAGVVRLRPILMTTSAMVFGMIPVALALSEGGEQRAPMAVVVIGGLITSTLLTLVVVPVVYALIDAARERLLGARHVVSAFDEAEVERGA